MKTHNIHTSINSKDSSYFRCEVLGKTYRGQFSTVHLRNKAIMRQTKKYSFVSHTSIKYRSRFYMWELNRSEL